MQRYDREKVAKTLARLGVRCDGKPRIQDGSLYGAPPIEVVRYNRCRAGIYRVFKSEAVWIIADANTYERRHLYLGHF